MNKAFDSIPHRNVIVENGKIEIPSIFMFKGGGDELFPFLYVCKKKNCTVRFENEDITVLPEEDAYQNVVLSFYATVAANPVLPEQYMRYLNNLGKMKWADNKNEG